MSLQKCGGAVLNDMKTGKNPGPSDVSMLLIAASRDGGIHVMV